MTNDKRDVIHELADATALLGTEYETTRVECDPGDSAMKVTKQGSDKTLYVIAYSNPDDTEMHLYDGPDSLIACQIFHDGSLDDLTPEQFADRIIKSF